jgi:hypothetical protein
MKNLELASPSEMSACARAGEITTILAAAIVRTLVTNDPKQREVGLASCPTSAFIQPPINRRSCDERHAESNKPWRGKLPT